jgi:hypothetical protein
MNQKNKREVERNLVIIGKAINPPWNELDSANYNL